MMDKGWIKLHRSLLDWEWYDDINTMRLFVHLILKANHKPKKYKGKSVGSGQVITGRKLLSNETGLTEQQIRTCIKKLKSTNELTVKADGKGSVIQLVNYRKYQQPTRKITNDQPEDNQPSTNHQPTINQQITTNKKEKNVKNGEIVNQKIHPALIGFRNNVLREAKELGITSKVAMDFFDYWTVIDEHSGKFLYQATDPFGIKNRLKNWQAIEDKKKKDEPTAPKYKEL